LSLPPTASAAINDQLNFQGRLRNSSQAITPDGDYHLRFKIYSGGDGNLGGGDETLDWTETYTTGDLVRVENGYFNVQLGSLTSLSSVDFNNSTLWLSIEVGGSAGSATWDGEMDPFIRLTATPYAFNSDQLDGLDSSDFAQLAPSSAQSVNSANAALNINQTGSGGLLNLSNASTGFFQIDNDGVVAVNSSSSASSVVIGLTNQGLLLLGDDSSNAGGIGVASLGQDTTYTLPDPGSAAAEICLNSGNCTGSGGGGAPFDAQYLTLAANGNLSNERIFAAGTNLSVVDGGANSNLTLNVVNNPTFSTSATTPLLVLTNSGFNGNFQTTTLTANHNYTLPDATGTVCLTTGNCAGTGGNGDITGSGTANQLAYFDASKNITSSANLLFDGADFNVQSSTLFVDGGISKVGIGTNTFTGSSKLLVDNGSATYGIRVRSSVNAGIYLNNTSQSDWGIYSGGAGALRFRDVTNAQERFTIDAQGDVGIGDSNPTD